jgi:hypothetical protein
MVENGVNANKYLAIIGNSLNYKYPTRTVNIKQGSFLEYRFMIPGVALVVSYEE